MIEYKGRWLSKNSDAYKLWEDMEWKKLDEHLARLEKEAKRRGDWYES